jgi:NDP-sugar pyrophosphorylase family protein
MQIDYCLILAAGFGTRMGAIGKVLPKVLWPVFEKSLLYLQVAYARSLGVKKIFINLHFMGEEIEQFCRQHEGFEDVEFLWERPEILDIGGAVHNLAAQPAVKYKGKLLVLNADQFFYIQPEELKRILKPYAKFPVVLFSYWVNSSLGYNALEIDEQRMVKAIVKNKDLPPEQRIETYTGISLVDLAQLDKVSGKSAFFESVCIFEQRQTPAILLEKIDYWDFGTTRRYWESSFKILSTYRNNANHPFLRFLIRERALKSWKIGLQNNSYNARSAEVINLDAEEEIKELGPSIILSRATPDKRNGKFLWYKEIVEEVSPGGTL